MLPDVAEGEAHDTDGWTIKPANTEARKRPLYSPRKYGRECMFSEAKEGTSGCDGEEDYGQKIADLKMEHRMELRKVGVAECDENEADDFPH